MEKGRWIHPDTKLLLDDLKWYAVAIPCAWLFTKAITGIYYLCEFLKTINIS